jgi:hypothetical protein
MGLSVFRVLWRISGTKREEVIVGWRQLDKKLHGL